MHECWWTRNRRSELRLKSGELIGMGVPSASLRSAFTDAGNLVSASSDPENDHGEVWVVSRPSHSVEYSVAIHDGCFFVACPSSTELLSVIGSALTAHHARLAGVSVTAPGCAARVAEMFAASGGLLASSNFGSPAMFIYGFSDQPPENQAFLEWVEIPFS